MVVQRRGPYTQHIPASLTMPHQSNAYLNYYRAQAGHGGAGMPRFQGAPAQYGYGLGGLLGSIIRRIIPIGARLLKAVRPAARAAVRIAKPHVKAAAKDLATTAARHVAGKLAKAATTKRKPKPKGQVGGSAKRKAPQRRQRQAVTKRRRVGPLPGGDIF